MGKILPATNYQNPEHSIMDLFGKQVYLGNAFVFATGSISLADTSEHQVLYVANGQPVSQTSKAIFISSRGLYCSGAGGTVIWRTYSNPTGVSSGSAGTPVNQRPAYSTASIATITVSPTASTNGTLMSSMVVVTAAQQPDTNLLIVDPGQSILITAQCLAASSVIAQMSFYQI